MSFKINLNHPLEKEFSEICVEFVSCNSQNHYHADQPPKHTHKHTEINFNCDTIGLFSTTFRVGNGFCII